MLYSDLTLISIIMMIDALILNQSIAADGFVRSGDTSVSHPAILLPRQAGRGGDFTGEKTRIRAKFGGDLRINSHLDPIALKLKNVVEKYDLKRADLEDLYMGVVGCGLSRCEKFQNLIPENQRLRHLNCFKKQNEFKKMVSDLLSSFHVGVQRIDKSFQALINFEKLPNLSNRSRRRVLREFKIDIKTLNVEIESAMRSRRLNLVREKGEIAISRPENQTHLMIYEWRIIQASKKFLRDWQRNLRKVLRCWKKRRQRNRERKSQNG